ELYKGQVFVISVHAGDFAEPDSTDPNYGRYLKDNFICQAGTDWFTYKPFNIDQNPKGMVNRLPYKTKTSFLPADWAGAIGASVALPKAAIISISNNYDSVAKILTANIGMRFLTGLSGNINLCVCVLEDSIYGGQLNSKPGDSTPIIKKFRFMDVLRGSLNGSWGELIATNPATNFSMSKPFKINFNDQPKWVARHCNIVAFIMDADTKEVYHVAKMAVVKTKKTP
ncbi:MAG: Omp28-related outer membrane protein, partial [Bacteroidota bacterium]